MTRKELLATIGAGLAASLLSACGGDPAPTANETPTATPARLEISTLSYPADWLVARLGGDRVATTCVLPAGEDAPFWNPPAEVIAGLANADLIVKSGAGYEKWTETASLPAEKLVDASRGLSLIEIDGVTHSHGPGGEHSHAGVDPHVWSDPLLYLQQAEAVHAALVAAHPDGAPAFDANLAALRAELEALDRELAVATEPARAIALAANHPSFNYLARRYGLTIEAFHLDPEAAPSDAEVRKLEAWLAASGGNAVLIWESPPMDAVRAALPPSLTQIVIDPLEQPRDGGYDYLGQARANVPTWQSLGPPPA